MNRATELVFERDTSSYQVDGQRVVSVTEALAIAGLVDFSGVPVERLAEAAGRGRMAHGITALIDRGKPIDWILFPEGVTPYVGAYERFRAETGFAPILIEHPVVNRIYRYAGTLDRLGWLNGEVALVDLKCGAAVPRWTGLQLAGYELALPPTMTELLTFPVKRFALRLKPDETYSLVPFRSHSDRADFLAAVRVAHWQLQHGGWVL